MIILYDFFEFGMDILKGLLITGITGLVGFFLTKKYFKSLLFANKLKKCGFLQSVQINKISDKEKYKMFNDADEINIINVSSKNFINTTEGIALVKKANDRGCKIKILVANPTSQILSDIETLERAKGIRQDDCINSEILSLKNNLNGLVNVEIRYFNTEYRLPIVLSKKYKSDGSKDIKSWLTVTLPPYKSKTSFILRGKKNTNDEAENEEDDKIDFIDMMVEHFDEIWNQHKNK